ncbi:MAG TPA: transcriptional regulator [Glutamicibacter sp.]|uniref:Phage-related protein n=1 Tax=Glutamicibacter arilaitensis (strain DSM 16368 / CIP 108037 / IAM 15318 / JCM 13566 / NCIMB 14258 / Re117) TaxID=861360 RepID=A0ABM9PYC6_GLUAR|nr:phage-related protein [Glutamicibacter arilaitensis Re117]HCH48290.1 transcriptional regulator [Glutamicibacter sp.]
MTIRYLSLNRVAQRFGISPHTAKKYADEGRLPVHDAEIGDAPRNTRGWLPETIDTWNATRPGHGGRPRKTSS